MDNTNKIFEKVFNECAPNKGDNASFERIYNESKERLTEVGPASFWSKIQNKKTGASYANSFINLWQAGNKTPINLTGSLKPERYKFNGTVVPKDYYFGNNGQLNTFYMEKVYEEMLIKAGKKWQKNLQTFIASFINTMAGSGIAFAAPRFVDYDSLMA